MTMKKTTWTCIGICAAASALGACGSMDAMGENDLAGWESGSGYGSTTSGSGGSANGPSSGTSVSATSGGYDPPPPVEPPAKPDEPLDVACEQLDQTKPLKLYLSADDSNSMASPARARQLLNSGIAPTNIRTYEFLNYYNIDYPTVDTERFSGLGIFPQMAAVDGELGQYDLQIGVRAPEMAERRPVSITLVLDTSGSMTGDPIARERDVIRAIATSLRKDDIVNAVTWSTTQAVNLNQHVVSGPNDPKIIALANNLSAGGGTNLSAGLKRGYQLAEASYAPDRLNRLVLISDGGANTGITDENLIGAQSKEGDKKEGIYLVGVGAGHQNGMSYNDQLMDVVTDMGRGAYVYVDSKEEADSIFGERFNEVMEIAARSVQVELTLPWYFQMYKFYGEEFSEDPKEIEPQHLAPGDVMIFNQVIKACSAELVDPDHPITVKISYQDPHSYASKTSSSVRTVDELLNGPIDQLLKGKAIVAYAEALKTGLPEDLKAAQNSLDQAGGGNDSMLMEINSLLQLHPNFGK